MQRRKKNYNWDNEYEVRTVNGGVYQKEQWKYSEFVIAWDLRSLKCCAFQIVKGKVGIKIKNCSLITASSYTALNSIRILLQNNPVVSDRSKVKQQGHALYFFPGSENWFSLSEEDFVDARVQLSSRSYGWHPASVLVLGGISLSIPPSVAGRER